MASFWKGYLYACIRTADTVVKFFFPNLKFKTFSGAKIMIFLCKIRVNEKEEVDEKSDKE